MNLSLQVKVITNLSVLSLYEKLMWSTWLIFSWLSRILKISWMFGTYPDWSFDHRGTSDRGKTKNSLTHLPPWHHQPPMRDVLFAPNSPFRVISKAPVDRKWVSIMLQRKYAIKQEKIYQTIIEGIFLDVNSKHNIYRYKVFIKNIKTAFLSHRQWQESCVTTVWLTGSPSEALALFSWLQVQALGVTRPRRMKGFWPLTIRRMERIFR